MEESARKRRRVSTEADQPTTNTSQQQSPSRRNRPSFASPTRASLSRHNPQILQRRQATAAAGSPSRPAQVAPVHPLLPPPRTARELFARPPPQPQPQPQPPQQAENIPASESNQPEEERQPSGADTDPPSDARAGFAAPPRPSPAKPSPRPLPPPAPEGDDELNPFLGRTLRRSPNTGIPIPPPPEPELPPVVSDPVSSTPPRGIHSSPSSRWRGKDKSKKSSPMKSSPLKNQMDRFKGQSPRQAPGSPSPRRRSRPLQDLGLNTTTNFARQVPAFQKQAGKIKERDRLRQEILTLRREIDTASLENDRIRKMQNEGRTMAPSNEEEVLNLVRRTLSATGTAPGPDLAQQMAQAALSPMGILPFGRQTLVANQGDEDLSDIKSHHPVIMTAKEELPFLQLFSPFSIASQVSMMPPIPNMPLRQRRQLTLRSRDVRGLFTARIDMMVNAMSLNVLAVKIGVLEPCARTELGPFLDRICSGECNRTMQYNVGILSWAMADWYRVALQRAHFWSQLEQGLAEKADFLGSVAQMRTTEQARGANDQQDDTYDSCDKADLFRYLGQQSFDVPVPTNADEGSESYVRLEWRIDMDWTGEAQSKVALLVGVPGEWREADDRSVFGQFPKLFADLIEGGQHPRRAIRTIVALLTGAAGPS